ncbi:MAG TPA: PEP-CTERM sorting domain-containing protein [Verrucomicrobiae bacterium]|nr:PEP-CTERM sorting domain-containing protein [Verrucomicrobiae bacterium]
MKKLIPVLSLALLAPLTSTSNADTLAIYTFENSIPSSAGPFSAEVGAGSALGFHSGSGGTTTYSSPAGNGSAHSFSANGWGVGDYFQFQVNTIGYSDVTISWDQASSNTGPGGYKLAYSTDGSSFSDFMSYTVLANATPNTPWNATTANSAFTFNADLSAISAIANQGTVFFRLVDTGTVSAANGVVAATGTDRVDNFMVSAVAAPEPSTAALSLAAGAALLGLLNRRSKF